MVISLIGQKKGKKFGQIEVNLIPTDPDGNPDIPEEFLPYTPEEMSK